MSRIVSSSLLSVERGQHQSAHRRRVVRCEEMEKENVGWFPRGLEPRVRGEVQPYPCKEKARIKRRPKSRSLPGLHFNTQSTAFLHQDNQPIECYIDASASQSICLVLAYYFSTFCPGASGHPPLWLQRITTSRVGHCKSQLYSVHCMCDRPPQIINRTCPPGANFQGNPLHLPTNRFKTGPSCLHRLQDYHTCLCSDLSSKTTRHIHKHRLTQPSLVQSSPVPPPLALDLDSNTADTTDTLISDPSLCCALHRITCKPVGS